MRYRQIFLILSVMLFVCGCGEEDAGGKRREIVEKAEGYQSEKIYIKGPEGTPFAFLVERGMESGEVVRKGTEGWGESGTKQEIDERLLAAALGENVEEKEKSQKMKKIEKSS